MYVCIIQFVIITVTMPRLIYFQRKLHILLLSDQFTRGTFFGFIL